jgi:putative MFS transporter
VAIVLYGLGWGVVNWGFITFLPAFLSAGGLGRQANTLLFFAQLIAIPNTVLAAWLYARWSSRRAMLLYSATTVVALSLFAVLRPDRPNAAAVLVGVCTLLLAGTGGMIAMLSPYATEVYPTSLRATGSGLAAAASKAGGVLGPVLILVPGTGILAAIGALPVAVAALVLWRSGVETAGKPLVEVTGALEPAG